MHSSRRTCIWHCDLWTSGFDVQLSTRNDQQLSQASDCYEPVIHTSISGWESNLHTFHSDWGCDFCQKVTICSSHYCLKISTCYSHILYLFITRLSEAKSLFVTPICLEVIDCSSYSRTCSKDHLSRSRAKTCKQWPHSPSLTLVHSCLVYLSTASTYLQRPWFLCPNCGLCRQVSLYICFKLEKNHIGLACFQIPLLQIINQVYCNKYYN